MSYQELLARRQRRAEQVGRSIDPGDIHPMLKPFQRRIVHWAVTGGRRAVWADTGLGKTMMMIEWCRLMADTSLIAAPLAVCQQTVDEAAKIGVDATYIRSTDEITGPGVYVTNHEMIERIDTDRIGAVALDEASILKQSNGRMRNMIINHLAGVPYRTAWTATPAPNDPEELTSQSEFVGAMSKSHMLSAFFINEKTEWRLKKHARTAIAQWMNTWAMAVKRPSDLGDTNEGYILPGLRVIPEVVDADIEPEEGELFAATIGGVSGRSRVRRETLQARVQRAAELADAEPDEPWMFWCGLNDEATELAKLIPGAVNVHGSMKPEDKAAELRKFATGETQILISKPSIAAMGLNWQHCARTAFVGLGDSYEQYYQAIRRFHRFGQARVVHAHIVLSELEGAIAANVTSKERQHNTLIDRMIQLRKQHDMEVAA